MSTPDDPEDSAAVAKEPATVYAFEPPDPDAPTPTQGGRIQWARERAGFKTATSLAQAMDVGLTRVTRWESGETRTIPDEMMARLAALLRVSPAWLRYGGGALGALEAMERQPPPRKPIPRTSGHQVAQTRQRDFPLYAAAECGDGAMVLENEPIDWLERPEYAQGNAFALVIVGESMENRVRHGDVVEIDRRPPRPGDLAVFVAKNTQTGERRAMVKELVRTTADRYTVRQYNPEKRFDLAKAEWGEVFRVIGLRLV